jgi:hypothetical protein
VVWKFLFRTFFGILSSSILIIWPAHYGLLILMSSTMFGSFYLAVVFIIPSGTPASPLMRNIFHHLLNYISTLMMTCSPVCNVATFYCSLSLLYTLLSSVLLSSSDDSVWHTPLCLDTRFIPFCSVGCFGGYFLYMLLAHEKLGQNYYYLDSSAVLDWYTFTVV